jgi:hypothetical protein
MKEFSRLQSGSRRITHDLADSIDVPRLAEARLELPGIVIKIGIKLGANSADDIVRFGQAARRDEIAHILGRAAGIVDEHRSQTRRQCPPVFNEVSRARCFTQQGTVEIGGQQPDANRAHDAARWGNSPPILRAGWTRRLKIA